MDLNNIPMELHSNNIETYSTPVIFDVEKALIDEYKTKWETSVKLINVELLSDDENKKTYNAKFEIKLGAWADKTGINAPWPVHINDIKAKMNSKTVTYMRDAFKNSNEIIELLQKNNNISIEFNGNLEFNCTYEYYRFYGPNYERIYGVAADSPVSYDAVFSVSINDGKSSTTQPPTIELETTEKDAEPTQSTVGGTTPAPPTTTPTPLDQHISINDEILNNEGIKGSILANHKSDYTQGLKISANNNSVSPLRSEPAYIDDINNKAEDTHKSNLSFDIPVFDVEDYINDRNIWQKQLYSYSAEQGWFYFKIFFKFDTNYGLLGGIMSENNKTSVYASTNTAINYLYSIRNLYKQENINDRMLALYKFNSTLKTIATETPWFFKSVAGLNNIAQAYTKDFGKEKVFDIVCSEESVDMRLGTLFDLYRYVCYDNINCKEILPANLRKFDMSIMIYHIPIKYLQTAVATISDNSFNKNDAVMGKSTRLNDIANTMSFKLYSFSNCEFMPDVMGAYVPDTISNETAYNLGKNAIRIKYDRVYEHRMNEWTKFMFGDDGFAYNQYNPYIFIGGFDNNGYKRNAADANNLNKRYSILTQTKYMEASEALIHSAISSHTMTELINNTMPKQSANDKPISPFTTRYQSAADLQKKILDLKVGHKFGLLEYTREQRVGIGASRRNTAYLDNKLANLKNKKS